ncbi:MAG: dihydroneopterin aldolase [Rhodoblastus sp.]
MRDFLIGAHIGAYKCETSAAHALQHQGRNCLAPERVADDFRDIVSYDVIIDAIRRMIQSGHVKLVKTMAEIAAAALLTKRVKRVRVRVEKLIYHRWAPSAHRDRARTGGRARTRRRSRPAEGEAGE